MSHASYLQSQSIDDLKAQRISLLRQLNVTKDGGERVTLQAEITAVNAAIKAVNIAEAMRVKAAGDAKRVSGRAQSQAELARAISTETATGVPFRGRPRHLGEDVIMHAKRLAKVLAEIPEATREDFTNQFGPQLNAFIDAQRAHLKAYNVQIGATAAPPEREWEEAWRSSGDLGAQIRKEVAAEGSTLGQALCTAATGACYCHELGSVDRPCNGGRRNRALKFSRVDPRTNR